MNPGPLLLVALLGLSLSPVFSLLDAMAGGAELLAQADAQAREGQFDKALAGYREVLAQKGESAVVHTRLGGMWLVKQDYRQAVGSFKTAIGLDAGNAGEAFIGLGIAYLHLGQYGLSRAALNEARERKPDAAGDIERLTAWLDGRLDAQGTTSHPGGGGH